MHETMHSAELEQVSLPSLCTPYEKCRSMNTYKLHKIPNNDFLLDKWLRLRKRTQHFGAVANAAHVTQEDNWT